MYLHIIHSCHVEVCAPLPVYMHIGQYSSAPTVRYYIYILISGVHLLDIVQHASRVNLHVWSITERNCISHMDPNHCPSVIKILCTYAISHSHTHITACRHGLLRSGQQVEEQSHSLLHALGVPKDNIFKLL